MTGYHVGGQLPRNLNGDPIIFREEIVRHSNKFNNLFSSQDWAGMYQFLSFLVVFI